ncbi:MAG TPA: hypothetical protein VFP80_11470 [Thermoanaerobaculia bacterium]|nr:hypothetical protein [Thermoanaerobaculia bacterium]
MAGIRFAVLTGVLLTAVTATASHIVVEIVPASPAVRCSVTSVVVKTAGTGQEVPLAKPMPIVGASASVPLTISAFPAEVVPIAKGCWAAPLHVAGESEKPVRVEMWPAAIVLGGLAFEKKSETARAITGTLLDPGGRGPEMLSCELNGRIWRCVVPAGRLFQLQVAIDDFAPLFVWDVNLEPARAERSA